LSGTVAGVKAPGSSTSTGRPPGRPTGDTVNGREALLAAALNLFPRWGFAGTRVEDLVAEAGVTAPVLYHHFGTKAGLYVAAAHHVYQAVIERHEVVLAGDPTFAEAVDRLMQLALDVRAEQPTFAQMMLAVVIDMQRNPDLAAELTGTVRAFRRFFDRIAALAPEHLRPTPAAERNLARALVTLMNGLDITALMARTLDDYTDTVTALNSLLKAGTQAER
jgi:AcrR family transcriptional regulator